MHVNHAPTQTTSCTTFECDAERPPTDVGPADDADPPDAQTQDEEMHEEAGYGYGV